MSNDLLPYVYALVRAVRDDSLTGDQREFLIICYAQATLRPALGPRASGIRAARGATIYAALAGEPVGAEYAWLADAVFAGTEQSPGRTQPAPGWVVRYLIGGCSSLTPHPHRGVSPGMSVGPTSVNEVVRL
jgi:hypothetical protein